MSKLAPRSTCRNFASASEHHLSPLPRITLPLTAFSGPSVPAQGALPLAALFNARFAGGAARKPYTVTRCENDAAYTLPFATVGLLNFAKFNRPSAGSVLSHKSTRFSAL